MEKEIYINITGRHFKNAPYHSIERCPLAKAILAKFPMSTVTEGVKTCCIDNFIYWHEEYTMDKFIEDRQKASLHSYSNDIIIRRIKLDYEQGRVDKIKEGELYSPEYSV